MSEPTDRVAVKQFLAKQITKKAKGRVDEQELAEAVSEIELETETAGTPFINVHLIDPYYRLLTSDFLSVAEEHLDDIEVEFPEGSRWWWRLCKVEVTNDLSQPNLILTFRDRIVAILSEVVGNKKVPTGTQTRAEFIRSMIDEANLKLRHEGKEQIRAVIPSLHILQEVEKSTGEKTETLTGKNELGQETLTSKDKAKEHAKVNKAPQVGEGAKLTVGGVEATRQQIEQANILLKRANEKQAPVVSVEALMFAAIAESRLGAEGGSPNSAGYWGTLQGNKSEWPSAPSETEAMVDAFLDGGKGFQGGGAIALSRTSNNPIEIAVKVEVPSVWPENAYAQEPGYDQFLPEAQAIINAGGGVRGSLLHGSGSTTASSDVPELQRGTPSDPYENTWDCIQRLASAVRWSAWVSGMSVTSYVKGRFFYFMDGFDFIRQKPAAYLEIPANKITDAHTGQTETGVITTGMLGVIDNTAWEYAQTHKVKGRLQRHSRITKPQTPSELRIPLICRTLDYQSGDVFVVRNSGSFNGRWVVTDTVRNYIEDSFTMLTLAPPLLPYPEPAASSSGTAGSGQVTGVAAVAENAQKAYAEKAKYQYSEGSDRGNNGTLYGPEPRTMDCSSFAELCYKEAGMPDPSGQNYTPIGNTTSMIARMVKTNNPVPGDLCFYGENPKEPQHVTVYIGGGSAIGMEQPGVKLLEGPVEELGPKPFIGYYRLKGEYATEVHSG